MNKYGYSIVYVKNVVDTLSFYEKAFGFTIKFITPEKDYGELDTGSTILAFAAYSIAEFNGIVVASPDTHSDPLPFEIAIVTEEIENCYQRAIDAGAKEIKKPGKKPWGQIVGYVRDINGFLVEVCTPVEQ